MKKGLGASYNALHCRTTSDKLLHLLTLPIMKSCDMA